MNLGFYTVCTPILDQKELLANSAFPEGEVLCDFLQRLDQEESQVLAKENEKKIDEDRKDTKLASFFIGALTASISAVSAVVSSVFMCIIVKAPLASTFFITMSCALGLGAATCLAAFYINNHHPQTQARGKARLERLYTKVNLINTEIRVKQLSTDKADLKAVEQMKKAVIYFTAVNNQYPSLV